MAKTIDLKKYKRNKRKKTNYQFWILGIKKYALWIAAIFLVLYLTFLKPNAYAIYYGEQYIGTFAKDKQAIEHLYEIAKEQKRSSLGATDIRSKEDFQLKGTRIQKDRMTNEDFIIMNFVKFMKVDVKVAVIKIDEKDSVIVGNKREAQKLLDEYSLQYKRNRGYKDDYIFVEKVEITEAFLDQSKVMKKDVIEKVMRSTVKTEESYTVKKGDTFASIETRYSLSPGELQKQNPSVSPTKIREGQNIRIRYDKPILSMTLQ